jgi:hypothetical protein
MRPRWAHIGTGEGGLRLGVLPVYCSVLFPVPYSCVRVASGGIGGEGQPRAFTRAPGGNQYGRLEPEVSGF